MTSKGIERRALRSRVYVQPTLSGRLSLPLESAKRIQKDPANHFYQEALEVIRRGQHWIWT